MRRPSPKCPANDGPVRDALHEVAVRNDRVRNDRPILAEGFAQQPFAIAIPTPVANLSKRAGGRFYTEASIPGCPAVIH